MRNWKRRYFALRQSERPLDPKDRPTLAYYTSEEAAKEESAKGLKGMLRLEPGCTVQVVSGGGEGAARFRLRNPAMKKELLMNADVDFVRRGWMEAIEEAIRTTEVPTSLGATMKVISFAHKLSRGSHLKEKRAARAKEDLHVEHHVKAAHEEAHFWTRQASVGAHHSHDGREEDDALPAKSTKSVRF